MWMLVVGLDQAILLVKHHLWEVLNNHFVYLSILALFEKLCCCSDAELDGPQAKMMT